MALNVHLCCGKVLKPGFLNVDSIDFGQEVTTDLDKKWSFLKDNSVDYMLIDNGLEHLDSVEFFLAECSRALKKGGRVEIIVPHYRSPSAYRLTHRHYFSWSYFNVFPEAHDTVQNLKVVSNKLIVERRFFPLTLLNFFANLLPGLWERHCYCSGIDIIIEKT